MKVLSIDDEYSNIKGIEEYCNEKGWQFIYSSFKDNYWDVIIEEDPDVVILDWIDQGDSDSKEGHIILQNIWRNGFRPVIVFSGQLEALENELDARQKDNSILFLEKKGDEEVVTNILDEQEQYFCVLSSFRKELADIIAEAYNAISSIQSVSPKYIGDEQVKYFVAKRAISAFDIEKNGVDLPAWGMYIVPPISNKLMTGDLIRSIRRGVDYNVAGAPNEYYLIITPSCDIAQDKVKKAMCLPCLGKEQISDIIKMEFEDMNHEANDEIREKIDQVINEFIKKKLAFSLNQGFYQKWAALPEMKGVCPNMSVNLKNSQAIKLEEIATNTSDLGDTKYKYVRVASLDAPYVSQIVWAFMQNVCRPGAPDRDVETWANAILS